MYIVHCIVYTTHRCSQAAIMSRRMCVPYIGKKCLLISTKNLSATCGCAFAHINTNKNFEQTHNCFNNYIYVKIVKKNHHFKT